MLPRPPGVDALCHCVPSMYSRWRVDCCEWRILRFVHDFGNWLFFSSTKSFSQALATQALNRQWLPCPSMRFSLSQYYSRMFLPALTSQGSISNKSVAESVPILAKDDASQWFWAIFAYWSGVSYSTVSNHNPHLPLNNINRCSPSHRKKDVASGRCLFAPHMYCLIHHVHVNDIVQRRWIH